MSIRTAVIVAGLATLAGGCTVAHVTPHHERGYSSTRVVYHENDSYEGYYYVRIVYINGAPWYIDEYRRARPVPRHLHAHFRHSAWTRSLPPRFGHDDEVRDGYHVSRIVYINDVPHYVDDDRRARPVPSRLRNRFTYVTVVRDHDRDRRAGERREYGRDDDRRDRAREEQWRERRESPAYVRERERDERPAYVREHERREPAYVREREEAPSYGRGREEPPQHVRMRDEPPVQAREEMRHERGYGRERETVYRGVPPQAVTQEREERGRQAAQGRGRSDDERIERGRAPEAEQGRGRVRAAGDDGRYQRGAAKGDDRREDNRKGKGRGKDEDEAENEAGGKARGRY